MDGVEYFFKELTRDGQEGVDYIRWTRDDGTEMYSIGGGIAFEYSPTGFVSINLNVSTGSSSG